jgi:hypothetical protein
MSLIEKSGQKLLPSLKFYSEVSNLFPVTSSVLLNTTFQFVSKKSTWASCAVNSLPESERIIGADQLGEKLRRLPGG